MKEGFIPPPSDDEGNVPPSGEISADSELLAQAQAAGAYAEAQDRAMERRQLEAEALEGAHVNALAEDALRSTIDEAHEEDELRTQAQAAGAYAEAQDRARERAQLEAEAVDRAHVNALAEDALRRAETAPTAVRAVPEIRASAATLELTADDAEAAQESKKELDALEKSVADIPEKERQEVGWSLHNIGFQLERVKSEGFAKVYGNIAEKFNEQTTLGRFFGAMKNQFTEKAATTQKQIEDIETLRKDGKTEGLLKQLGNAGYLSGNLLKYGRIVSDAVGWTAGASTRWVTLGAMASGSVLEGAKEARLANEEVKEETRIADIDKAADEAWAIYEGAMTNKGLDLDGEHEGITKEELTKAYQEKLPADILRRLAENPKEGTGSSLVQKMFQKHIAWAANRIQKKLDGVEANPTLDEKGKVAEREAIIARFGRSKMLADFDRMLSQQGVVDTLAMSARYGEQGAKAVVYGMMADSLYRLWDHFGEAFAGKSWDKLDIVGAANAAPLVGTDAEFGGAVSAEAAVAMRASEHADITANASEQTLDPEAIAAMRASEHADMPANVSPGISVNEWKEPDLAPDSESGMTEEELAAQQERARKIYEGELPISAAEGVHKVVRGDTLWTLTGGNPAVLRLSPEELRSVGVSSGNANLIRIGEKLNTERLEEILRQKQELGSALRRVAPEAFTESMEVRAPKIPVETLVPSTPKAEGGLDKFLDSPAGKEWLASSEGKAWSEVTRAFAENKNLTQAEIDAIAQKYGLPRGWGNFKVSSDVPQGADVPPVSERPQIPPAQASHGPDVLEPARSPVSGEIEPEPMVGAERFPSGRGYHMEGNSVIPDRRLSEISPQEMARWPKDIPKPWPVEPSEAERLFGSNVHPNRHLAENVRLKIGRYPNEDEFRLFSRIQMRGEVAERQLMGAMQRGPYSRMQADEYERMVRASVRQVYEPRGARPRMGYPSDEYGRRGAGYPMDEGRVGRPQYPFEVGGRSSQSQVIEQRARDIWMREKLQGNPRADQHFERNMQRAQQVRMREMGIPRGRIEYQRDRGGADIARVLLRSVFGQRR